MLRLVCSLFALALLGCGVNVSLAQVASEPGGAAQDSPSPPPSCKSDNSLQLAPLNFRDLDSHLRDCEIPFDELEAKSPFCKVKYKDGRRCEHFSYSQFPEVVKVTVNFTDDAYSSCSGTLISDSWVLTAAHCFLGEKSTSFYTKSASADFEWAAGVKRRQLVASTVVEAPNMKMIEVFAERSRMADRIIVFSKYTGRTPSPPFFDNDIALIHLRKPYPQRALQPVQLATKGEFSEQTTIAGYGYSNANGGQFGKFVLTWPKSAIKQEQGQLSYTIPRDESLRSGFCGGDSGGPVFAGRYRGCQPYDVVPECRPHLLQGTISYNYLVAGRGETELMRNATACRESDRPMVMIDITTPERHDWICKRVNNNAEGCR